MYSLRPALRIQPRIDQHMSHHVLPRTTLMCATLYHGENNVFYANDGINLPGLHNVSIT